jgi:hypothetical protein
VDVDPLTEATDESFDDLINLNVPAETFVREPESP